MILRPSRRRAHRQALALHFLGYTRAISDDGWVYPIEVGRATGMSCASAISALHALMVQWRVEGEWVPGECDSGYRPRRRYRLIP